MKREIEMAVEWWANELKGAPEVEVPFGFLRAQMLPLHWMKLERFRKELTTELMLLFRDSWDETDPSRGEESRCISVDYGPDPILYEAMYRAKVPKTSPLPFKTRMYVSPGCVKIYRSGAEKPVYLMKEEKLAIQ